MGRCKNLGSLRFFQRYSSNSLWSPFTQSTEGCILFFILNFSQRCVVSRWLQLFELKPCGSGWWAMLFCSSLFILATLTGFIPKFYSGLPSAHLSPVVLTFWPFPFPIGLSTSFSSTSFSFLRLVPLSLIYVIHMELISLFCFVVILTSLE